MNKRILMVCACLCALSSQAEAAPDKAQVWVQRLLSLELRGSQIHGSWAKSPQVQKMLVQALDAPGWLPRWRALRPTLLKKPKHTWSENPMYYAFTWYLYKGLYKTHVGAVTTRRAFQMLRDPDVRIRESVAKSIALIARRPSVWDLHAPWFRRRLTSDRALLLKLLQAPLRRRAKAACRALGVTPNTLATKWPHILATLRKVAREKRRSSAWRPPILRENKHVAHMLECQALFPAKFKELMPLLLVMARDWWMRPSKLMTIGPMLKKALALLSPRSAEALVKELLRLTRKERREREQNLSIPRGRGELLAKRLHLFARLRELPLLSASVKKVLLQASLQEPVFRFRARVSWFLWSEAGVSRMRLERELWGGTKPLGQKLAMLYDFAPKMLEFRAGFTKQAWGRFRGKLFSLSLAGLRSRRVDEQIHAAYAIGSLFGRGSRLQSLQKASPALLGELMKLSSKASAARLREVSIRAIGRMGVVARGKGFCPGQKGPDPCILQALLRGLKDRNPKVQMAAIVALGLFGARARPALSQLARFLEGHHDKKYSAHKIQVVHVMERLGGPVSKEVLVALVRARAAAQKGGKLRYVIDRTLRFLTRKPGAR